jgi:hypothetical protein
MSWLNFAAARSAAGTFASGLGGKFINTMQGALLTPVTREANYGANRIYPSGGLIPDIGEIVRCYVTHQISYETMSEFLRAYGVNAYPTLWSAVVRNSFNWPDLDVVLRGFYRGVLDSARYQKFSKQLGFRDDDAWQYMLNTPYPWNPEVIRRVYAAYQLDQQKRDDWLAATGMALGEDRDFLALAHAPPSQQEILALWNRTVIDEKQADQWLTLNGLTDQKARDAFKTLRTQIPSPSALIEMSVKEVWNNQVVTSLGYDDEFDQIPAYKEWMQRAGFGGSAEIEGLGAGQPKTWAQAYWRAHWRVISNSQAYTMLHRLRPTGGISGGPRVPSLPSLVNGQPVDKPLAPVTLGDVETVLKINDFPPVWRDRLAAISYLPMRLVDIRQAIYFMLESTQFRQQILPQGWSPHQWAAESFQDRGQTAADADVLAHMSIRAARRRIRMDRERLERRMLKGPVAAIIKMYNAGLITVEDAAEQLKDHDISSDERDLIFKYANQQKRIADTKQELRWLERQVLAGKVTFEMAPALLSKIGIVTTEQQRYLNKWKLLLDESQIIASTNQVVGMYLVNLIDYNNAVDRLNNLGWTNAEEILGTAALAQQGA